MDIWKPCISGSVIRYVRIPLLSAISDLHVCSIIVFYRVRYYKTGLNRVVHFAELVNTYICVRRIIVLSSCFKKTAQCYNRSTKTERDFYYDLYCRYPIEYKSVKMFTTYVVLANQFSLLLFISCPDSINYNNYNFVTSSIASSNMSLACSSKHKKLVCDKCTAGTNCTKCCMCQPRSRGRGQPRKEDRVSSDCETVQTPLLSLTQNAELGSIPMH